MYMTQPLHKALIERPQRTALVCGPRRKTFAQFADRVARFAGALRALGLQPGDRVGIMALNSDRYVEFFYAVWWAGGVVNTVNVRWSPKEVAYALDDCDTRILLADDQFAACAAGLPGLSQALSTIVHMGDGDPPAGMLGYEALITATAPVADAMCSGSDLAAIFYTGGTTGRSKGAMLTHANLYLNALSANAAAPRAVEAVGLLNAPLFHIGGAGHVFQLMARLCKQVVLPAFDEVAVLEAIRDEGVSELFLVPLMVKRLIEHPRFVDFDLRGLKQVLYGAAPIDEDLLAQAMKALPCADFCQAYGMTELSPVLAVLPAWCHRQPGQAGRLRSAGLPVPIAEVRIVDANGRPVPNGTVGEIVARGPQVMAGYWGQPAQTAEALKDGWMHTGDGGYMDDDGFIYVVDRLKDMVVTGGENVYSAEVENAIAMLKPVAMCGVIGVPDDTWGERVHAVIVVRPGQALTAAQVMAHCREHLAGYKCPRSVEFRADMPLSAAGKLLKHALREPYWHDRGRKVN
ncbi:fatty-acid--CoA ligase [Rhodoferax koreense]|uniref:Fatty-acid--CoA ligase n=1 Tax=Rhodoferax koreensis TaxID=1842727 RepID=A0A1P8K4P2_9BURK|nr:long-chain-fatty-acid--CoA ligase [Rhodoferax koreense]APW40984.1 fatty-acid--CoA ligase [Rhodoferax koreense]